MNLNRLTSYLLILLIAIGSAVISSASASFESCSENAFSVADSTDFSWIEIDEDTNNPDSLTSESTKLEFNRRNSDFLDGEFSQVATPPCSNGAIRAPPLSF